MLIRRGQNVFDFGTITMSCHFDATSCYLLFTLALPSYNDYLSLSLVKIKPRRLRPYSLSFLDIGRHIHCEIVVDRWNDGIDKFEEYKQIHFNGRSTVGIRTRHEIVYNGFHHLSVLARMNAGVGPW